VAVPVKRDIFGVSIHEEVFPIVRVIGSDTERSLVFREAFFAMFVLVTVLCGIAVASCILLH